MNKEGLRDVSNMIVEAKDLLERAKRGDMDAFALLFEPLRGLVRAVAFRIVGPADADDATMETFLKAWQAIPGFRGASSLRTWLCRIARNCCLDMVRKRKRMGEVLTDDDEAQAFGNVPCENRATPLESVIKDETAELVRDALAGLTPEHRQTILLRYVDDLSYLEIGAVTGASVGTVMSRLYYAKRKLHNLLEGLRNEL